MRGTYLARVPWLLARQGRYVSNSGLSCGTSGLPASHSEPFGSVVRSLSVGSGFTMPTPKSLDSILKLDTIKDLPSEELSRIWHDYHTGGSQLSAVMQSSFYQTLHERALASPLFVLPVKKEHGFLSVLIQAQMPHFLFTGLEDYKRRGSSASPYLTVTHYTELAEARGLVLVRGDIVLSNRLSEDEAYGLLTHAHTYYLDDERYKMVELFNQGSKQFDFEEILKDLHITNSA